MTHVREDIDSHLAAVTALLRAERRNHKVSQTQLGEKIGVQSVAISAWETRTITPSLASLTKWADALGWRIDIHPAGDAPAYDLNAYSRGWDDCAREIRAFLDETGGVA